ncbi:TonB-dependent receptor [Comamonas sp. JC664]|uniref:TonB-dependent receptor plug domain-containing protein n=1 Tax=Comamonas sp. JC664 TaxID=2801917 RepID=UPI00174D70A2|nr:TonB-dependent receptor [Comamonas sp. JC664]MBL0696406.1 TonB-dependent receptor [Comamonas sp. JC664]GHG84078.1 hypothetical protein GCM10012319_39280 [Comamonas sp. KCTC 72670]
MKTAHARATLLSLVLIMAVPGRAEEPGLLHSPPERAEPRVALPLDATLVEGRRVLELYVRYRGPGEPYARRPMEREYGDLYRAMIPAEHVVPPGFEYYIEGLTADGERVPLFQSASRPARVLVGGETPASASVARPPPSPPPERRPATGRTPRAATPERAPPPERPRAEAQAAAPRSDAPRKVDDSMAALTADLPSDVPAEPTRAPRAAASTVATPAPRAAAPARSELEEDLALYSAEDTLALATRHEATVRTVPAIGASFGRQQLRSLGARTVADVLDVVPGLSVSRDVQGFHRTAIRGLRNDAEVLFLLNGHRLNNFFDGKALMNLPVENLERVEVIRGPGSALHGAGAFLGVVNIVTDRTDGVRSAVSVGGFPGQEDRVAVTGNGHLSAGHTVGDLRLFADVDVWSQAGDSTVIENDGLDDESISQGLRDVADPAGRTRDDRFLFNVGAGASYALGSAGRLGASARYLTERRSALLGLFDAVGEDSELGWDVFLADLTWERSFGPDVTLRARAAYDQQSTDRFFQITPRNFTTGTGSSRLFAEGMQEQTRVSVRSLTGSLDADVALSAYNRLSLGAVVEQQTLGTYAYETNYTLDAQVRPEGLTRPEGLVDLVGGPASRRLNVGLFAQDQWTVVDALTLTFGVRMDATQLPTVDASGVINGTRFVPTLNPRVGLVFAATDALVLKALYGRAFRAPTLQELVERIPDTEYNQGRFEGNPRLQPATVDTFELGADLVQAAGDARVRLRANAYVAFFGSPIVPVDTSGNIVPLRNRELGVRVYGVEGEARLEASKRAYAWLNASISRAEDLELPAQSRLLTDTPQARFNAGVSMPIGAYVNFDVVVRTGAERRNNSRSVLELIRRYKIPSYSLITAQLRTEPILDHFEVALVAHNLFDNDLRDDVPRPDRVPGLLPREGMSGFLTVRAQY